MRPRLASCVEEEGCLRLAAFASRLRLSLQRVLDLSIVGEGMAGQWRSWRRLCPGGLSRHRFRYYGIFPIFRGLSVLGSRQLGVR